MDENDNKTNNRGSYDDNDKNEIGFDVKEKSNFNINDLEIQSSLPLSLDLGIQENKFAESDNINKLNKTYCNTFLTQKSCEGNNNYNNITFPNIPTSFKDNEFYAYPSPFIKDGINLGSFYMNTINSKNLDFSHNPQNL